MDLDFWLKFNIYSTVNNFLGNFSWTNVNIYTHISDKETKTYFLPKKKIQNININYF